MTIKNYSYENGVVFFNNIYTIDLKIYVLVVVELQTPNLHFGSPAHIIAESHRY